MKLEELIKALDQASKMFETLQGQIDHLRARLERLEAKEVKND